MGRTFTYSFKEPTQGNQTTEEWRIPEMLVADGFRAQVICIPGMKTSMEWGPITPGFEGKRNMIVWDHDGKYVWGDVEFMPNKRFSGLDGIYNLDGDFRRRQGGYYGNPLNSGACLVIVGYWNP